MTTDTAGSTARELHLPVVHYFRKGITFSDTGIGTDATVKVGTLPIGAIVEKVQVKITTAFDAGTTNVIDVGTSTNDDAYVDGGTTGNGDGDVDATATGSTFVWRGADETHTAATTVYVTYTQTGSVATAGAAEIIMFYTVDNDQ